MCHLFRINLTELINEWWRLFPSGWSIWLKKSIRAFYPSHSYSSVFVLFLRQDRLWSGSSRTYWGVEVDVVPVFSHRRVLCTRFLTFCSHLMLLDGNFPCTGLNACDAAHDFNFFLSPWSLGLHVSLFVCDIFSLCLCSSICVLSAFWMWVCVYVFTCLESVIAGSMQDFESSADQVTKHE